MMNRLLLIILFSAASFPAISATCPNANLLGQNIINGIPWKGIFPMTFGGQKTGGGDGWIPDGAYSGGPVCSCNDQHGVPEFGVPFGMWEPNQALEIVSKDWCSSIAGGKLIGPEHLPVSENGQTDDANGSQSSMYNYIQWSFPILKMMTMFTNVKCNDGLGYSDVDIISPSFVIPTWNNEPLAFFTNPMSILLANPFTTGLSAGECMKLFASDRPIDSLPGSAGCWGNIYPLSGYVSPSATPLTASSLISTRALAFSTSMGLNLNTVGNRAMCKPEFSPKLKKDAIKESLFYPSVSDSTHPIGKPPILWGMGLSKPTGADAFVKIVFKYTECCLR